MSSSTHSNISQNNTEILEKQWQEMQQRHKEKQQFLLQLEEVEGKAQEKAERQRVVEEKERKRKMVEYLQ